MIINIIYKNAVGREPLRSEGLGQIAPFVPPLGGTDTVTKNEFRSLFSSYCPII
jgi:hypothetical protein